MNITGRTSMLKFGWNFKDNEEDGDCNIFKPLVGAWVWPENLPGAVFSHFILSKMSVNHKKIIMSLSPLPAHSGTWSRAIHDAYSNLNAIYSTALAYIHSDGLEAHWLQQYGTAIITDAYPLLILLEDCAESEGLPPAWAHTAANQFTELLALVDEKWVMAKGECIQILSNQCICPYLLDKGHLQVIRKPWECL